MDWPVVAGNGFLVASAAGLALAPVVGAAGGWRTMPPFLRAAISGSFLASLAVLITSWWNVPRGATAAASGHAALLVSVLCLSALGRLTRRVFHTPLAAGLAGMSTAIALTVGPFALGRLLADASLTLSSAVLMANPLVTVASAAGIDLLHLDVIYRLSPLAHRGVALPAWTSVCGAYAVLGLAGHGASHLRPRSA